MRSKQRLGQASRFEQSEAQQHRIAHAGPDGGGHIPANADILHQHGIDVHAHHDEKRLESQSKCVNHVVAQSVNQIALDRGICPTETVRYTAIMCPSPGLKSESTPSHKLQLTRVD